MMYLRLWRYRIPPGREADFIMAYGPAGDWAQLFLLGEGCLGTELLHPASPGIDYATSDRWRSVAVWQRFLEKHGDAYRELGRRLAPLCTENVELGNFTC
jgi:hypothetical protein